MANAVLFPISGWENNLASVPSLTEGSTAEFYSSRSATQRCFDRSYNFSVESYVVPSTLTTNSSKRSNGLVFIKAQCYRSKKKTTSPYTVIAAVNRNGQVVDGNCGCPAGKVACNHLVGMLRTVALLRYSEAPRHMSCTDLPQQWRVRRGSAIKGSSIQAIDWRSFREDGLNVPKLARPTERWLHPRTGHTQAAAKEQLCRKILARDGTNAFARALLLTPGQTCKETKYGLAPASSPISYQQALLPHGFSVHLSGITPVSVAYSQLVPVLDIFRDIDTWRQSAAHQRGSKILQMVGTTRQTSLAIERDTRQQSRSATWLKERSCRLTSFNFGVVLAREEWTVKGLEAMTASRDISMVPAIRYGIVNEPIAAKRYEEVLRTMGHDVTVVDCGLLVNPAFPWLGASPDRLVFDPAEGSYGVLEIKCPYSLREKKGHELAGIPFCSVVTENGPRLNRDNYYYAQIIGQMGVSGLSWGDFAVYGADFILIERIRLNQTEWEGMKDQLNYFYFNTLLPLLESAGNTATV